MWWGMTDKFRHLEHESADDWVSACINMEVVLVRIEVEVRRLVMNVSGRIWYDPAWSLYKWAVNKWAVNRDVWSVSIRGKPLTLAMVQPHFKSWGSKSGKARIKGAKRQIFQGKAQIKDEAREKAGEGVWGGGSVSLLPENFWNFKPNCSIWCIVERVNLENNSLYCM